VTHSDWSDLMAIRAEAERASAVLPVFRNRAGGAVREPSARTVRFAEALAVSPSWTGISEARRRRYADAA
jgi:hypothetical protein